ncbi:hypothetical protein PybrP1_003708 [[Pythium] brassicae (nom. inval.)]|nr:hypothetical protein PybrP1_003708 [[Pythium] brassicae (nom. inval.)]
MSNRNVADALANAAAAVVNRSERRRRAAAATGDVLLPEDAARENEAQADALVARRDLDAALQCLDKAIFLQPARSELYAKRAHVFWELGDLKSAMASYRKLLTIDARPPQRVKDQFAALLNLHGYSLLRLGEAPAVAIAYLSEAVELNGLEESYWLHRALAHVRAGGFDKALQDVDHCICLNARDVEYFVLRAKLHWRLHMHERASSDIQRAATLAPDHPEVTEHAQRLRKESQAIYAQARRHAVLRDFAAAIACLDQAAEIAPDDTRFYLLRAAAHRELGEHHVALQDAETAMALHRCKLAQAERTADAESLPASPRADRSPEYRAIATQRNLILSDIARRFLRDKAFQLALNAFNQAMRGEAELAALFHETLENPEQLVSRGDAYRGLENFQAALADYHHALEMLPANGAIRARVAVIHYQLGVQLFNKAQFERAAVEFSSAIAQDPAVAEYFVRRGDAERYLDKREAACADYQRALQLEPRDQETKNKLLQYAVQPLAPHSHAARIEEARRQSEKKHRVVHELFLNRPVMAKKQQ